MNLKNIIWVEKYRPACIEDCIIPNTIKHNLEQMIIHRNVPNLMIHSTLGGSGKTTVVRALAQQLEFETLFINASEQRGIDVLRTDITQFVTTVSLEGKRKCVIFDEFDNATSTTQSALRNFIEQFSHAKYFFTCNFIDKVIQPLQSRCSVISFTWSKETHKDLKNKFYKRVKFILEEEGIKYNRDVVIELIQRFFPDFRRILNELERYSVSGIIDEGLLSFSKTFNLYDLFQKIKEKKFTEMRQWIEETEISDYDTFFKTFYREMKEFIIPSSLPACILLLDQYEYRHAFVIDKQVNLIALCTEIMQEAKFQ